MGSGEEDEEKTAGCTIPSSPAKPSIGSATGGGKAKGADSEGIGGMSSSELGALPISSIRNPWASLKLVRRGRPDDMVRVGTVGGLDIRENVSLIRDRPCALSILARGLFGVSIRSNGGRSGGRTSVDPDE